MEFSMLYLFVFGLALGLVASQNDVRSPPNIVKPERAQTLYFRANSNVTIPCQAGGIPTPTYSWTRDSNPIPPSEYIKYDAVTGDLHFNQFSSREEGTFMCMATNVFDNPNGARHMASSFSPPVTLFQTRIGSFNTEPPVTLQVSEYSYIKLPCSGQGEIVANDISFNWYKSEKTRSVDMDGGRLYIDQTGDLHFAYTLRSDATLSFNYLCGVSSIQLQVILLGNVKNLNINNVQDPRAIQPQLQYSNNNLKGMRFGVARLECVFSGYDPIAPHIPVTKWYDDSGKEITATGKYSLSEDRRSLTITGLEEQDERKYFCQAENSAGTSSQEAVFLDVTSPPIFYSDNGAPKDQIVPEDNDVVFYCDARSATGEQAPEPPVWYINGKRTGTHTNPNEYQISSDGKKMTIKKVKKATHILCVQCEVKNHVGTTWGDACLNVILPITISTRPKATQEIDHGDMVNLTVTAETDPSMTLKFRWIYKNMTYQHPNAPPHVTYDSNTLLAFINTSALTEEEYKEIGGVYERQVYHQHETKSVFVEVVLKDKPEPATTVDGLISTTTVDGGISTPNVDGGISTPTTTSITQTSDGTNLPQASSRPSRHDLKCHLTSMTVHIPVSLAPNSKLMLRDPQCVLTNNGTHHVTTFAYDTCGTSVTFYQDYKLAENEVKVHMNLNGGSSVAFDKDYSIPLKCQIVASQKVAGAFQAGTREPTREESTDLNPSSFVLREFKTSLYQEEITHYPVMIPLNREIYVELALNNSKANSLGLKVNQCTATPTTDPLYPINFKLLYKGCPVTTAAHVQPRPGPDRFRFSVQAFHFQGDSDQDHLVFIHCDVSLCPVLDCDVTCDGKRRRNEGFGPPSVTLTSGPHLVVH